MRVAEEVEATDTFYGDNLIVFESVTDSVEFFRIIRNEQGFSVFRECQLGAAGVAGDGLRMKTAMSRVSVFSSALIAHLEVTHRGRGTIVGAGLREREARAAMSAGEEKILVSAIVWIVKFGEAFIAEEEIWRDFCVAVTITFVNLKIGVLLSGWLDAY